MDIGEQGYSHCCVSALYRAELVITKQRHPSWYIMRNNGVNLRQPDSQLRREFWRL
jgi:hypothetical protein